MQEQSDVTCAVIVLNWMRVHDTMACCASVLASEYPALVLVVCDNGSPDGSYEALRAEFAKLGSIRRLQDDEWRAEVPCNGRDIPTILIKNPANLGYAGGNNAGLRAALATGADLLLIVNNDCALAPSAITEMMSVAASDPGLALVGALVCDSDDRETIQSIGGGYFNPWLFRVKHHGQGDSRRDVQYHRSLVTRDLDYLSGSCVLVRRAALEAVGFMRDDFFLYFEELEWSIRMRAAGWRIGVASDAIAYHKNLGRDLGRRTNAAYYYTRNGLYLIAQYFPVALATASAAALLRVVLLVLRGRLNEAAAVAAGIIAWVRAKRGPRNAAHPTPAGAST